MNGGSCAGRHVLLEGDARERGRSLGHQLTPAIRELLYLKRVTHGAFEDRSLELGRMERAIARHAPVCHQELLGLSDALSLPLGELLVLSFEYESWMNRSLAKDKCSGFASVRPASAGTTSAGHAVILGQTNDEDPADWHGARFDTVIRHRCPSEGDTLIYTHPGIPAYMGINAHGVVCLWQYIDNGERCQDGVPTTALIREALTRRTVDEALAYLRATPRSVPNNFILGGPQAPAINIECSPTCFTATTIDDGDFCHTNHVIVDPVMKPQDLGVRKATSTTLPRFEAINRLLGSAPRPLGISDAQRILSTPPIHYERTLASMVFIPERGLMSIRFKGDDEQVFRDFSTGDPVPTTA